MKRMFIILISMIALVLSGCSGSQTPTGRTAQDEVLGEGGTQAGKAAKGPLRHDISGEAQSEFNAAVKRYHAAAKTGLSKSNCADLADAFARLFDSYPRLPEAKFNEALVWEECGDQSKAEQTYKEVLLKYPNYGPALNNLGEISFRRGNVDAALSYFKRAAEQKNSEGYANLAMIQRNQALHGNTHIVSEAISNIHRSLAVNAFNIEAYATMALILYDHANTHSQLEMARLICVQATKVNDHYAPIYNILGLILLRMGKVTPALAEFRKAVALDGNFLEAHMNIGAVTLSFRDYKSAENAFATVLNLYPNKKTKVEALIGLGVAYRGQRRFQEAMEKYKEAKALDPANLDITYNMGVLVQDYTFDASNPAAGIASLRTAASYLQQYASSGRDSEKVKDANKRIRNISEMIPMLLEQQRMTPQIPARGKNPRNG